MTPATGACGCFAYGGVSLWTGDGIVASTVEQRMVDTVSGEDMSRLSSIPRIILRERCVRRVHRYRRVPEIDRFTGWLSGNKHVSASVLFHE
jgi:hypothetical protein